MSGLCVDVLGSLAAVAPSAAWAVRHRDAVLRALRNVLGRQGVDSLVWMPAERLLRKAEGWSGALGDGDEPLWAPIVENGVRFAPHPELRQKTGFYADQRESRRLVRSIAAGKSVLDVCCYTGGFALNAAAGGAERVLGVDSSQPAVDAARRNAALNGLDQVASFARADVKKLVAAAREPVRAKDLAHSDDASPASVAAAVHSAPWDLVILDPPKLAPSRGALERAARVYAEYNAWAMGLVRPGGLLMTCTCSGAMTQAGLFMSTLQVGSAGLNGYQRDY